LLASLAVLVPGVARASAPEVTPAPEATGDEPREEAPSEAAEPTAPETAGDAPPPEFVPAELIGEVVLDYPSSLAALEEPPSGTVKITFVVGTDGTPKEIAFAQRVAPQLDALALETVAKLRFRPATYLDQPVEMGTELEFPFVAPPKPEPEPEAAPEPEPEPEPVVAEGPVRIRGELMEAGMRTPIANASVLAVPAGGLEPGRVSRRDSKRWQEAHEGLAPAWTVSGTTDEQGRFELRGVPDGPVMLIVLTQGFDRYEYVVNLGKDEVVEGKYYQTRSSTNPYRTTVAVDRDRPAEVTRRRIRGEELETLPGSQGDAIKGLQNLPGMARTPLVIGAVIIRGAAPGDSGVYLGDHEVPQIFHFGGLTSVFPTSLIEHLDYIPSNFGSRYGDATGGIIDVGIRKGRRDGYHGSVDLDLFDGGAVIEGPVGKGSFAVGARRSWADGVLRLVNGVPLAPRYWDYQGSFSYPVGPGELQLRAFGSHDELIPLSSAADGIESTVQFHRVDLDYRVDLEDWKFSAVPSFAFNQNISTGNETNSYRFGLRAEALRRFGDRFGLMFGTELGGGWADLDISAPQGGFGGGGGFGDDSGPEAVNNSRQGQFNAALYSTFTANVGGGVTLSPGVRLTGYAAPGQAVSVDPRFNAQWEGSKGTKVKAGVGLYSQMPATTELDEVFGNPDLGLERSVQTSVGVSQDLPSDINVEVTGFYKHLWDTAVPSFGAVERNGTLVPERFASTGSGRSYGMEVMLRRDFSRRFSGWIAYTLSRTETRNQPGEPLSLSFVDQTHILTLIAQYKFGRGWTLGSRFRLVSGFPSTPTTDGVFDADTGEYTPLAGAENSDRLPMFHQLDLRVDKMWTFRKARFSVYLDIQNVYNQQNAEFVIPSFNYQTSQRLNSLPIFPTLGLKVDF
jgi:hypothetical protein